MYIETSFVLYMLLYICTCTCIYMLLFICHTHHADLLSVQYSDFTMCGVCPLTSICTYVTRKCTILDNKSVFYVFLVLHVGRSLCQQWCH